MFKPKTKVVFCYHAPANMFHTMQVQFQRPEILKLNSVTTCYYNHAAHSCHEERIGRIKSTGKTFKFEKVPQQCNTGWVVESYPLKCRQQGGGGF